MKDEENEKAAWSRFRKGSDSPSGICTTGRSLLQDADNSSLQSVPGGEPVLPHFGGVNRLMTQNLAKAPPGRPPAARGHPPSGETQVGEGKREYNLKKNNNTTATEFGRPLIQIENERFNTSEKTKQYKLLNFITMKKQILFLAFLVLAGLAGMNAFGQTIPYQTVPTGTITCLTPAPFANGVCTADELHPVQGTLYTYTVTNTAATDVVRWFVVNNNDLKTASPVDSLITAARGILPAGNASIDPADGNGDYILSLGTPGTYDSGVAANTSIQISWKYFDGKLPNEVLLVAYVEGGDGCTNNIAVYRIIPQPAFTIDVASINEAGGNPQGPGSATPNEECVSKIQSAFYTGADNTTPNKQLTVDYGENWVFFVVNGANYIDSWMPQFQLTYAGGTAPVAEASWAYIGDATDAAAGNWHTLTGSAALSSTATTWTSAVPVIAGASAATPGTVGAGVVPATGGECIVVRVRLDWGTTIEHDQTDGTLTFAADGIAFDGVNTTGTYFDDPLFGDLDNTTCATDGFTNDKVDYIITPRPQIENATTAPSTIETKTGDTVN